MGDHEEQEAEQMQAAPAAPPDERVALGTKVRASTRKRLRRYAVEAEVEIRDVVDEAIDRYLQERGY